ncbi:SPOSA6832_02387, partial [Sporobolomyces salmonicolor]
MLLPALRRSAARSALPRFPRPTPIYIRCQSTAAGAGEYSSILVSSPAPGVSLVTLNRPKALNGALSLNSALFHELNSALESLSTDDSIGAVVLTGSDKAFAAGADIKEMKDKQFAEVYKEDFLAHWTELTRFKKPIVAAVSGYAATRRRLRARHDVSQLPLASRRSTPALSLTPLPPGVISSSPPRTPSSASPKSTYVLRLGVIPGAGGTQRLTHALGKSRAMELVLTGQTFTAAQASEWGLVSRVVSAEDGTVVDEAVKLAGAIASKGRVAVQAAKEGVNAAYELSLQEGLHVERRLFHQLFATNDQKIGMKAFAEKKKPEWTHS